MYSFIYFEIYILHINFFFLFVIFHLRD
ncbi:hypothetical protein PFAG_02755 [Plasmodium falciparum Santa Lucia]|uniref:Uncharacterized protein n=1 Tax=Plasmodium falciparum Santa Lucia TaxID=478859 RepID=W7FIA5_PLAFA|nr:hypothetical protein PFAG_02755 [Plasmodium falciparum Santa Lucia]